jgi:uncharacterized membrane protein AbrB (regulator of aidB expression)
MAAGILVGIYGGTIRLPRPAFLAAQSVVGCLIATTITPVIMTSFVRSWPIFLGVVCASVGCQQRARMAAEPVGRAAGDDGSLGFVARGSIRDGRDG